MLKLIKKIIGVVLIVAIAWWHMESYRSGKELPIHTLLRTPKKEGKATRPDQTVDQGRDIEQDIDRPCEQVAPREAKQEVRGAPGQQTVAEGPDIERDIHRVCEEIEQLRQIFSSASASGNSGKEVSMEEATRTRGP